MKRTITLAAAAAASSLLVIAPAAESEASSPQSPAHVNVVQQEMNGLGDVSPSFIRDVLCEYFPC